MTDNAFAPSKGVPSQLVAGDFWSWRQDSFGEAYPSDLYSLSYVLKPESGGAAVTPAANSDADGWLFEIDNSVSATIPPGVYLWNLFVTRDADSARVSICTGRLVVKPDPSDSGDVRTPARKMLDAINSVLEGRITKDVEEYSIEGRALTRIPFEELRGMRARLMREVQAEVAAATGRPTGPRNRRIGF